MVKEESAKAMLMDCVALLTLLTMTRSMPVIVTAALVPAVPPATEMLNVSVPVPPLTASPAWSDVPVVLVAPTFEITALNVSLPEVLFVPRDPTKALVSTPVVSVQLVRCKSLILNSVIIFTLVNDEITT